MSMRHQIYVVLPYTFLQKNDYIIDDIPVYDEKESNIVGVFHRGLYGEKAVHSLSCLLKYIAKVRKNEDDSVFHNNGSKYTDVQKVILNMVSNNSQEAFILDYNDTHNPLSSDNNDGITVIDLRSELPKYCFMFLYEGRNLSYKPINAKEYLNYYYTNDFSLSSSDNTPIIGNPTDEDDDNWKETLDRIDFKKVTDELKVISEFELINEDEMKSIFPLMFQTNTDLSEEVVKSVYKELSKNLLYVSFNDVWNKLNLPVDSQKDRWFVLNTVRHLNQMNSF